MRLYTVFRGVMFPENLSKSALLFVWQLGIDIYFFGFIAVPYYTVVRFKTTWSFLVGLLRAHIVVKLFGSHGESDSVQLHRYLYMFNFKFKFVSLGLTFCHFCITFVDSTTIFDDLLQ